MITLTLSDDEVRALRETLRTDVSDLSVEVAGTDALAYRQLLHARKAILQRIADELGPDPADAPQSAQPAA